MAFITVIVPEGHPITVSPFVSGGSTQQVQIHHTPLGISPPNTVMEQWSGKGEGGVPLPPRVLTTVTGEFRLATWHWNNEVEEWEFNTTRVERGMNAIGVNTPGVREGDPVAIVNARISTLLEAEDGGGPDWNDVKLTLAWDGRVIGAMSWANHPTEPTDSLWSEISVHKHAHIYLDSVLGGAAYVRFLTTGSGQDLRLGAPVVVPEAQTIRLETRGAGSVSFVARIVDRV